MRFSPGDKVFSQADGAFAEYVCVPEDMLEHKPAELTSEEAAANPHNRPFLVHLRARIPGRDVRPLSRSNDRA